jgi:hypothetical protein
MVLRVRNGTETYADTKRYDWDTRDMRGGTAEQSRKTSSSASADRIIIPLHPPFLLFSSSSKLPFHEKMALRTCLDLIPLSFYLR